MQDTTSEASAKMLQGHEGRRKGTKTRSAIFFLIYLVLLLAAVVWVNTTTVRARVDGHLFHFYWLIGGAACYLGVRAFVTLYTVWQVKRSSLWDAIDLSIISGAVYLTGPAVEVFSGEWLE